MSGGGKREPNAPAALIALIATVVLGLAPSLLFYAWIERGGTLPWLPIRLGWPWIAGWDWPLAARVAWDAGLIPAFGVVHSFTAQPRFYRDFLDRILPEAMHRAAYVCLAGLSIFCVMGFWQPTGILVWALPFSEPVLRTLSLIGFWVPALVAVALTSRHDGLAFLGLRPLLSALGLVRRRPSTSDHPGSSDLITTGIYGLVRHPIYSFTLLAMALAPVMTLDRALVLAASSAYLAFAIPVEERKLVALFGDRYLRYREQVPAVIPGLSRLSRRS